MPQRVRDTTLANPRLLLDLGNLAYPRQNRATLSTFSTSPMTDLPIHAALPASAQHDTHAHHVQQDASPAQQDNAPAHHGDHTPARHTVVQGRSVSVRVDLGGRRN